MTKRAADLWAVLLIMVMVGWFILLAHLAVLAWRACGL